MTLTAADLEQLAARGIGRGEAERQLGLLRDPPPARRLVRPCTAGDGILVLDPADHGRLRDRFDRAAAAGRLGRMVPASGAASRMFRGLEALLGDGGTEPDRGALEAAAAGGDRDAAAALELFGRLPELPFADELAAALCGGDGAGLAASLKSGDLRRLLAKMLRSGDAGLGLSSRPKGLIPFHRYPDGPRTPFAEHLVEAATVARGADGTCRLHFTVGAEHRAAFEALLADQRASLEARLRARFEVSFSRQSPATDTLALAAGGRPFRLGDGSLLLRPGGHGSLLVNLDRLGGEAGWDLVQIRNIDNVVPDRSRTAVTAWQRVLGGKLVELQDRAGSLLERLQGQAGDDRSVLEEAERFAAQELGAGGTDTTDGDPAERLERIVDRLDRPLRVCAMVANTGEPGGGPFWVRDGRGRVTPQIVEKAEIDTTDPGQREVLSAATHFNPVDLVCALRDRHGRPYRLSAYADPRAVFIAEKSHQGEPLRALEHPGLWNGAMARWNTVFVEVPGETFAPVKTVFDLLRPEHAGPGTG